MNARIDPNPLEGFGASPQAPAGAARFMPWLKAATTGGVIVTVAILAVQRFAPESFTPATITGKAAGQAEKADILEKQAVKTAYEAGLAEAQAQAQARATMEIETNRQQQQLQADALQTQAQFANLADAFCIGGGLVAALGAQNTGADWHNGAQTVAQVSCGAGDALRKNITQQQAEAGRGGGALMTRNTYGQATAPTPVAVPPPASAPDTAPARETEHRYTWQQIDQARAYSLTLPMDTRAPLYADLPNGPDAWDVLTDRVLIYRAAHPGG